MVLKMGLEVYPLPLFKSEDYSDIYLLLDRPVKKFQDITYSWYIKGSDRPIIVDTGLSKDLYAEYGWEVWEEPSWDLVKHLQRLNVKPDDVGYIIHTHLHFDHCAQDHLFPNARIIVQRRELEAAAVPRIPKGMTDRSRSCFMLFYDRQVVSKFVGEFWSRLILLDGEEEIVPGVKCVPLGGHTPGGQAIYVETDKGRAIITGDVCYIYANIEQDIPVGYYYNLEDSIKALSKLRKDGKFILPGHDPAILDRYPNKIPP